MRDGYDNRILLCANDHTEADAQPSRYTVERLRSIGHQHELWVGKWPHDDPAAEPGAQTITDCRRGGP